MILNKVELPDEVTFEIETEHLQPVGELIKQILGEYQTKKFNILVKYPQFTLNLEQIYDRKWLIDQRMSEKFYENNEFRKYPKCIDFSLNNRTVTLRFVYLYI